MKRIVGRVRRGESVTNGVLQKVEVGVSMFEFAEPEMLPITSLTWPPHAVTISIIQHSGVGLPALDDFQVLDLSLWTRNVPSRAKKRP